MMTMPEAFKAEMTSALQPLGFETIHFRSEAPWNGYPFGVALEWPDHRRHAIVFADCDAQTVEKVATAFREWLSTSSPPDIRGMVAGIADAVDPGAAVNSFVVMWDDPLGFVWNVRPEDRQSIAARLRSCADTIEGE